MAIYIVKPWYKKSGGKIWVPKTWNGVSNFSGRDTIIWNDITYLFNSSNNLKLSGSTWSNSGIRISSSISNYISGRRSIIDSYNQPLCFYSRSRKYIAAFSAAAGGYAWGSYSGSPTYAGSGSDLWKTSNATYFSELSDGYYKQTGASAWTTITWNISFSGSKVWSDGTHHYYSNDSEQKVLTDESNYIWSNKTWYGLTSFSGNEVWNDGNDIYYYDNSTSTFYKLNKATSTWTTTSFSGLENLASAFYGHNVWHDTDGKTYYSYDTDQYELVDA